MTVLKPLTLRRLPARPVLRCPARIRGFVARLTTVGVARLPVRPMPRVWLRRLELAAGPARTTWLAPSWTLRVSPQARVTLVRAGAATPPTTLHVHRHAGPPGAVTMRETVRRERVVVRSLSRVEPAFSPHESRTQAPAVRVLHSTRIERHSAYPRLSVVLSRPPAPAPAAVAAAPMAMPTPPATRLASAGPSPPASPRAHEPLPPRELARVTDHVIAQLDRKVLSYRERHGQI